MEIIQYIFDCKNPKEQFLDIEMHFVATSSEHEIQLPSWRPGRYELGNFAKNVRNFNITTKGEKPYFEKIAKDRWRIVTKINTEYSVHYQYFAAELNAGSTYFSPEQVYVNPVNCCTYVEGMQNLECKLILHIPDDYNIACSLIQKEKNTLLAKNFDQLADSPFICSNTLKHDCYLVDNKEFNIWFQGECKPDFKKLKDDFSKFTQEQLNRFGNFPFDEYHFLFQIDKQHAHHGVEHLQSTVIYIGSSNEIFTDKYNDFLGVSSHELYHSWNVKTIRPTEMLPYDFTKENYSKLGYLYEGVTTYMGDLMLLRSNVFSLSSYLKEFGELLQKHFDNPARFFTNVADSSYDTWLDGYVPGVPGRKLSIYTEGALLSFVIDVSILKLTQEKHRIDDVMKIFYEEFGQKSIGVSESDFWKTIQKFVGDKLDNIWNDFYHGSGDFEIILNQTLSDIGLHIVKKESTNLAETLLGIKTTRGVHGEVVKNIDIQPGLEHSDLMLNDELIAINQIFIYDKLNEWLKYFKNENSIDLTVLRNGKLIQIPFSFRKKASFLIYEVAMLEQITEEQKVLQKIWSNNKN